MPDEDVRANLESSVLYPFSLPLPEMASTHIPSLLYPMTYMARLAVILVVDSGRLSTPRAVIYYG